MKPAAVMPRVCSVCYTMSNCGRQQSACLAAGRDGEAVKAAVSGNDAAAASSSAGTDAAVGRSWQLLEKVLTRTCAAWQIVEAEELQLAKLQKQQAVLEAGVSV